MFQDNKMSSMKSNYHGIEVYFTAAEFAELSEYEKLRLRNMKQNYEMMVKVGLDVPPPEFMRLPPVALTQTNTQPGDIGSLSTGKKKGHKRAATFKVPIKKKTKRLQREVEKPATISTAPMSDAEFAAMATGETSDDEFDGIDFEADFAADVKPIADAKKTSETEKSVCSGRKRYSLREGTRKSYKDLEVVEDDVYVYCEDCHELYEDNCPSHPLIIIKDSPVPVKCKHRAKLSLPPGLVVKEAGIQGAGDGVWAEKYFSRGVRFGPYGGEIVKERAGKESGYAWEIFQDKKRIHYINGKKRSTANWMRYVNCARNESEQNLIAFQYRSQIYYRSFKPIYQGNELLVYYGEEYAKELGIEEEKFEDDGDDHTCHICSRCFTGKLFLLKHLKYRHHQFVDLSLYRTKDLSKNQTLRKMMNHSQQNQVSNDKQGEMVYSRYQTSKDSVSLSSYQQGIDSDGQLQQGIDNMIKSHGKLTGNGVDGEATGQKIQTGQHQCRLCGKKMSTTVTLKVHERIHAGEKPYKCDQCGKRFARKDYLEKHERTHTGIKPYKCTLCDMAFNQINSLTTHERTHTGIKPYKCTQCDKAFTVQSNLIRHEYIHTGIKPYKCTQCDKAFTVQSNLTTHERIHTGIKPFKCTHCDKAFTVLTNLINHERTHTGIKPYKCTHCDKAFAYSGDLTKHERTHTGIKPYKCTHCDKAFAYSGDLTKHERTHTGIKPYKCTHCDKAFADSSTFTRHVRTHTGIKPFKCTQCNKAFAYSYVLTRHERTHTGIKPYRCTQCDKAFTQNCDLTRHERIHTGIKPYKCTHCDKAFTHGGHLTTHERTHTGIKPYKCTQCDKAFAQLPPLKTHIRTHTGIKPYKCTHCYKAFADSSAFTTHVRTHTGIKP